MYKNFTVKRFVALGFVILFVLFSTLNIFGGLRVSAGEKRHVKVGFFPMDGYNVTLENGTRSGMDVRYLEEVCTYADWEIEYVDCSSWDDALTKLKDKKIDLVGSAQFSAERAELYQYADLPSGYTFGVIAVKGASDVAFEDFSVLKDLRYGVVSTYVRKAEFVEYLSDNGIKNPDITEYEDAGSLREALEKDEIDAMVHTLTEVSEGQRVVGRFAPRPFYYISYKNNDKLINELNHAIANIKLNNPVLENELLNEFYRNRLDDSVVFTTLEKQFIQNNQLLNIGYVDGFYPFSYVEDGEFKGLSRMLLEEMAGVTGFRFNYVKVENVQAAEKALTDGTIDIMCYNTITEEKLEENEFPITQPYVSIPMVIVMKENSKLQKMEKVAIVADLRSEAEEALFTEQIELVEYEDQQECLMAIKRGEVDAAVCDGYLTEYLLGIKSDYSSLNIESVLNVDHYITMSLRRANNVVLSDIIEKSMPKISDKQISEYIFQDNTFSPVEITEVLKEYSPFIIGFLVLFICVGIAFVIHAYRDSIKIKKLLYKDYGMEVWNLNYLTLHADEIVSNRGKNGYAMVSINISQFRLFNTIYGWKAGQRLLEAVVELFNSEISESKEIFARDQGDRFILFAQYEEGEEAKFLARLKELKKKLEDRIFEKTENKMTAHFGVYYIPKNKMDIQDAVSKANQAMIALGETDGEEILVYDDIFEKNLKDEHEKEKLLRKVDIDKDFVAYYQAKVDIRNEKVIGAEALVRFKDPTANGQIRSPFFFVPYFEKTGRITEIDFFVMESVCRMLRRRMDAGKPVVTISCNFSRHHFMHPGFSDRFQSVLRKYDIPKELIEVEITETLVVEELQQNVIKKTIDELRENGIRISIDDFGSGYSSLGVFEQIPASVIKLDRSFLLNGEDRERQVAIMKGIVHMASKLDAQIVCEGVETEKDVDLMNEIGAYIAQGYKYARPVPEADFEERLDRELG